MRRAQRAWHLRIWVVLGALCAAGLIAAIAGRPRDPFALDERAGTSAGERSGGASDGE